MAIETHHLFPKFSEAYDNALAAKKHRDDISNDAARKGALPAAEAELERAYKAYHKIADEIID